MSVGTEPVGTEPGARRTLYSHSPPFGRFEEPTEGTRRERGLVRLGYDDARATILAGRWTDGACGTQDRRSCGDTQGSVGGQTPVCRNGSRQRSRLESRALDEPALKQPERFFGASWRVLNMWFAAMPRSLFARSERAFLAGGCADEAKPFFLIQCGEGEH